MLRKSLNRVEFPRAILNLLLVLGCSHITCGILPLVGAETSTPLTLQISSETAPPGGWAQFRISVNAPTLIASGQISMDFDPSVFGPVAQIAAFSSTGDQIGYATVNAQQVAGHFSSPSAGLGQLPELPVFRCYRTGVDKCKKPGAIVADHSRSVGGLDRSSGPSVRRHSCPHRRLQSAAVSRFKR